MKYISGFFFTVRDLDQKFEREGLDFYFAGRCLLDVIESLRVEPRGTRFEQIELAHTLRMLVLCLRELGRHDVLERISHRVRDAASRIISNQVRTVPYYGEDFWDWAYIVLSLERVTSAYPQFEDLTNRMREEVNTLFEKTKQRVDRALAVERDNEWFGPAVPVAVYRALTDLSGYIEDKRTLYEVLAKLKAQALGLITDGKYMGKGVKPDYHCWHYGQVVREFPNESTQQQGLIRDFSELEDKDVADRVYGLSRVLEGARAIKDKDTFDNALSWLYKCERHERLLGHGILSDTVKGSVNVLEALWPTVTKEHYKEINEMVDKLFERHRSENRIGILVAVEMEETECINEFRQTGAKISTENSITNISDDNFEVIVIMGKGNNAAFDGTRDLVETHKVKWLICLGIAGSMGKKKGIPFRRKFVAPKKGDVVVSATVASDRIREKVRKEVENAGVPWGRTDWMLLPAHPKLFLLSHEIIEVPEDASFAFWEGLIVTGNGIRDNPKEKGRMLERWPSALAVEEEGFLVGLRANFDGIPFIVVRGISDLAQGDKRRQKQDPKMEEEEQRRAARNAAKHVVKIVTKLSDRWYANSWSFRTRLSTFGGTESDCCVG
jgi:nucleoside phosphorylase